MAYERRTWYQRLGQGLNKFLIGEKDAEGKQELTNVPDSIAQQGDVISADNLNDLEGRIEDAFTAQQNEIVGMKLTKVWENLDPSQAFIAQDIDLDDLYSDLIIQYKDVEQTSFAHRRMIGSPTTQSDGRVGDIVMFYNRLTAVSIVLNIGVRNVSIYVNNGVTRIHFGKGYNNTFDFPSGTGTGTSFENAESNLTCIPVAIYAVGDIYNS